MSKKASKTLIGAFVLGAIVLVVAGVIVLGSGKFFQKRNVYVLFFDGSVKGLNIGSPVMFRGVKIGEVTKIKLYFDTKTSSAVIPVYAETDPESFIVSDEDKAAFEKLGRYALLKPLLEKGLKAQLQMQSFVTGQLLINVDFHPDKPVRLVGLEKRYPEIPTIPTAIQELQKKFEDLPLKEIAERLDGTLKGINSLVNSPELKESIVSLNRSLKSFDMLAQGIDKEIKPIASDIHTVAVAADAALEQARKTLAMSEGVPGEIAAGLKDTISEARLALEETRIAISNIDQIAQQNTNLGYELSMTLEQINQLSRSIRVLSDYLGRHPEALIRGKRPQKGE